MERLFYGRKFLGTSQKRRKRTRINQRLPFQTPKRTKKNQRSNILYPNLQPLGKLHRKQETRTSVGIRSIRDNLTLGRGVMSRFDIKNHQKPPYLILSHHMTKIFCHIKSHGWPPCNSLVSSSMVIISQHYQARRHHQSAHLFLTSFHSVPMTHNNTDKYLCTDHVITVYIPPLHHLETLALFFRL